VETPHDDTVRVEHLFGAEPDKATQELIGRRGDQAKSTHHRWREVAHVLVQIVSAPAASAASMTSRSSSSGRA
jgi:hypothetical protein